MKAVQQETTCGAVLMAAVEYRTVPLVAELVSLNPKLPDEIYIDLADDVLHQQMFWASLHAGLVDRTTADTTKVDRARAHLLLASQNGANARAASLFQRVNLRDKKTKKLVNLLD